MTEPIVGFVCLYASFQFALLYTFVVASPYVFMTVYGFSLSEQGLSFLGFLAGVLLSPIPTFALDRYVYHAKFVAFKEATKNVNTCAREFPPEHRLYGAMIGSGILPTVSSGLLGLHGMTYTGFVLSLRRLSQYWGAFSFTSPQTST